MRISPAALATRVKVDTAGQPALREAAETSRPCEQGTWAACFEMGAGNEWRPWNGKASIWGRIRMLTEGRSGDGFARFSAPPHPSMGDSQAIRLLTAGPMR
jgi:hypothetical protein